MVECIASSNLTMTRKSQCLCISLAGILIDYSVMVECSGWQKTLAFTFNIYFWKLIFEQIELFSYFDPNDENFAVNVNAEKNIFLHHADLVL